MSAPQRSLPDGWTEIVSENDGTPYYFHAESDKTQWDKPTFLPAGWTETISDNGVPYYFNTESGRTQWDKPTHTVTEMCQSSKNKEHDKLMEFIESNTTVTGNKDGLDIRELKFETVYEDAANYIRLATAGVKNSLPTKSMILVGVTGAGKTSLFSSILNMAVGVRFEDNFRIKVEEDECTHKTAEQSQTEWITVYKLNHIPGMSINFNLTIIDTPGLGDTRGMEYDRKMFEHLEMVLDQKKFGIVELHCVGIVTSASATRLTTGQIYVYDGCMKIFGKDVKEIIQIMTTYADKADPAITAGLKKAGVEYEKVYKFNNSYLFYANNSDDPDSILENKSYWKRMEKACKEFLNVMEKVEGKTTIKTLETLEARREMYFTLKQVQFGLFTKLINRDKVNCTEMALNCIICRVTCHKPCFGPEYCSTCTGYIEEGKCSLCSCKYTNHANGKYTLNTVFLGMNETDINQLIVQFNKVNTHVATLKDVALSPHSPAKDEYLTSLIEECRLVDNEASQKSISILQEMKEQEKIMTAINNEAEMEDITRLAHLSKNIQSGMKHKSCNIL